MAWSLWLREPKAVCMWKGTDETNSFSAFCYKLRKAKSCFNNFWVGVVKSERSHLVHGTLRSAILIADWDVIAFC